jgi:endothelin-converting enzyme/putative endopeptidase
MAPPPPPPVPEYAKDLLAAIDTKANACDDFYQYACGAWEAATPLPADKPIWNKSFSVIHDRNRAAQKEVLEKAAANPGGGDADWARLGNFYGSCMDEAGVDAAGTKVLDPTFAEIDKLKDAKAAFGYAGKLGAWGVGAFVGGYVSPDYKDPSRYILVLSQAGLGLPDRDYYLGTDDKSKALLTAYEAHVAQMLGFAGSKDAAKDAKAVVAFETAIATLSVPRDQLRDPEATYHKIDRAGLVKLTPKLPWDTWLTNGGVPKDAVDISVEVPEVYQKLEALVVKTDIKTLRSYLKWQLLHTSAPYMSKPIYDANFAFMGVQLSGQKEPEPRWKRCTNATTNFIGEIPGRYFVQEHFAGDSKDIGVSMIKNIETAFADGLPKLLWMDDPTRARAKEKIAKINNKIGYPDKWKDYSALTITPGAWTANVMAAMKFENDRLTSRIGKSVDRTEWYMPPAMVNAYYDPSLNEMVFPAGILQSPFFDRAFPAAMNYGSIGMIMGHELSHGFDDTGRKFDGDGRMVEWWAPEVGARFEERTACVAKQYDAYTVTDGIHVNGTLTLGENIADIGGLRSAYRAWKASGAAPANVPGLTDDQLFFVAAAQSWCTVASPEIEKMRVLSDTHSPPKYRVNGPVSDLPEFAAAFGCAEGAPMRPANACEVW